MMGWWGYGPGMMYGFGIFGFIFNILLLILIVVAVVSFIRMISGPHGNHWHFNKTPLEILQERYAKGEIDKKEFEEKKKELS